MLDETDNLSYASSVVSSSSDEESNPTNSRTPMRRNLRRESRKKAGNIPLAHTDEYLPAPAGSSSGHIEIPPWIGDVTEEVSAFIKESRYSDATELILKAKAEVSDILAAHEQPTPPVVTAPTSYNTGPTARSTVNNPTKKLHKKQQALLESPRTPIRVTRSYIARPVVIGNRST